MESVPSESADMMESVPTDEKTIEAIEQAKEKGKEEKLQRVFNLMDAAAIFEPLDPPVYLIPLLKIGPGRPSMFAGYGAAGKTIAAQSLALSVATGKLLWESTDKSINYGETKQTKVIHLDRDQGNVRSRRQYQRLAKSMGIDVRDLDGKLILSSYPDLTFSNDDLAWADSLEELILAYKDGDVGPLVILDAFVGFLGSLDENNTEAAKPLYKLGELSERTKATFLILHHARKGTGKEESGNKDAKLSIRGSSAIFGAIDGALILEANRSRGSGVCKVTHEKSPSMKVDDFHLQITSTNDPSGVDNGPLHCGRMKEPTPTAKKGTSRATTTGTPNKYDDE